MAAKSRTEEIEERIKEIQDEKAAWQGGIENNQKDIARWQSDLLDPSISEGYRAVLEEYVQVGKGFIQDYNAHIAQHNSEMVELMEERAAISGKVPSSSSETPASPSGSLPALSTSATPQTPSKSVPAGPSTSATPQTPSTFDQELDKAMADGTVDFTGIDSVLVGVGGAGKTHTLHMITDQPAPEERVSTPCTRPPVRMMISVESETMEMVGAKEYFGIIVDTAKEMGASLPLRSEMDKAAKLPKLRKTDLPECIHKLEEEMHQHLSKKGKNKLKLLYKMCWYRLTDSGGQPQFLEVISIFIHNISVGIIVIKLNERLDCFPMMEYYEDGKLVGASYRSCYSQEQVIGYFLRALTSQGGEGKDIKILFIGTHKDRVGECNESIEAKNKKLKEIIRSFKMEASVIYNGLNPIFPINAKTPGDEDWEVMKQVKRKLVKCADVPSIRIPLRWFIMDLALQRFVLETNQAVLTESRCWELVSNYHFDEASFKAGLEYLHQIKHILYYEEKHLVIADTQIIQNKLCEVVSFSIELRTNPNLGEPLEYNWPKLCEHGILHSSCLDKFPEGYIEGVFSPKELLQLFTRLCIVSELGSDEYLIPCVLQMEKTPCCNRGPSTQSVPQSVPAMVIEFPANAPMLGLFCGLVCYLMNIAKWKLAEDRGVPIHITRSSVHFNIPGYPGEVTFNDPLFTFFTLTFHGPLDEAPEVCPLIRETILTGIEEVSRNLHYLPQGKAASSSPDRNKPNITFLCPCKTTPLHPAVMSRNGKRLLHPDNAQIYASMTDQHKMWLSTSGGQNQQPVNSQAPVALEPSPGVPLLDSRRYQPVHLAYLPTNQPAYQWQGPLPTFSRQPPSAEFMTVEHCTTQLETALSGLERDLVHFWCQNGFISDDVRDKVLNPVSVLSEAEKAGEVVRWIKNRIKQDPASYHVLMGKLQQYGNRYQPIMNTLETTRQQLPQGSQMSPHNPQGGHQGPASSCYGVPGWGYPMPSSPAVPPRCYQTGYPAGYQTGYRTGYQMPPSGDQPRFQFSPPPETSAGVRQQVHQGIGIPPYGQSPLLAGTQISYSGHPAVHQRTQIPSSGHPAVHQGAQGAQWTEIPSDHPPVQTRARISPAAWGSSITHQFIRESSTTEDTSSHGETSS